MPALPTMIGDYAILPISIPPIPSFPQKATHNLYLRPHAPKIPSSTDSRSLFLVNVPIDSTEFHFRSVFTSLVGAGRFESITFENERQPKTLPTEAQTMSNPVNKKRKRGKSESEHVEVNTELPEVWDRVLHRSGSTAVVVLVDEKSVEVVLKAIRKAHKSGQFPTWPLEIPSKVSPLGSHRYATHHKLRYPSRVELLESVNSLMTEFNKKEEEVARAAKQMRNVPDEDGFITVTRGGRTGPARKQDAEEARRKELQKEEEKRKSMGGFYRFQGREKRKKEQGEMVKRFEEDRKKVEEMRKERRGRFRPE